MNKTPLTDREIRQIKKVLDKASKSGNWPAPVVSVSVKFAKKIERQRNTLIEVLQKIIDSGFDSDTEADDYFTVEKKYIADAQSYIEKIKNTRSKL